MNSITLEKLKTLIDSIGRINSNFSDINALQLCILESAMRLVVCESSFLLMVNKNDGSLHCAVALGSKSDDAKYIPVDQKSVAGWVVTHNQHIIINEVASDTRFSHVMQQKTGNRTNTMIAVPMRVKGECMAVIELVNKTDKQSFDKGDADILELFCSQASLVYQNADFYRMAQERVSALQATVQSGNTYHPFISKSTIIQDLFHIVEEVSKTVSPILITGESGVGKGLFAEQIHLKSPRCNKPFVRVNCASLSPDLLDEELFGHSDFRSSTDGPLQTADGGTLFFDEISALSPQLQEKVLRLIQTKQYTPKDEGISVPIDVRIVASTTRDLEQLVKDGIFRSDLYYRLNVLPINVPSLRDRKDDIEPLALFFLKQFSNATHKNFTNISDGALLQLTKHFWPGNVRELKNCIERACIVGVPPVVQRNDLGLSVPTDVHTVKTTSDNKEFDTFVENSVMVDDEDKTLKSAIDRFKKAYIIKILDETSWNQTAAGKILGIQRTYVSRLLNELHIRDDRQ
ncbi:MAG: sigma-54-dependent Fis family transcriptional regulator [Treponema sp.]|nr:sigma-54-dependent Fis family transcriptional regulator [Treponema sp.]